MKRAFAFAVLGLLAIAAPASAQAPPPPAPTAAPTTPDRRIELAAAAIIDEAGASFVEKIEWDPPASANRPGAVQEMLVKMAPGPWHKSPKSRKREVVDTLAKLEWRSSSWAAAHFDKLIGMSVRVYVGETFLGRLEIVDSVVGGSSDRFRPSRAWADQ